MRALLDIALVLSVALTDHPSLTARHDAPRFRTRRPVKEFSCLIHGLIEVYLIATSAGGTQRDNIYTTLNDAAAVFFPPLRIFAGLLALTGNCIRLLCFRALGRHFTFAITLLDDHAPVTTGPYALVRHPSYAGLCMMHVGVVLWHTSPGAWVRESESMAWVLVLPTMCIMTHRFAMVSFARPRREDRLLKERFGAKWDEYARRVRYWFVPGVY